jgi:hypothetical protein
MQLRLRSTEGHAGYIAIGVGLVTRGVIGLARAAMHVSI